jgi:hypothetical protein
MRHDGMSATLWRKSSYSAAVDNCVEVADLPVGIAVRDSRNPKLGHLAFPGTEWAAFIHAVREGGLGR